MSPEEIAEFVLALQPMIDAKESIDLVKDRLPEFNGNEGLIQALDQANYWVRFAIQCWGLQGKNIIDYNSKDWIGAIQELSK